MIGFLIGASFFFFLAGWFNQSLFGSEWDGFCAIMAGWSGERIVDLFLCDYFLFG